MLQDMHCISYTVHCTFYPTPRLPPQAVRLTPLRSLHDQAVAWQQYKSWQHWPLYTTFQYPPNTPLPPPIHLSSCQHHHGDACLEVHERPRRPVGECLRVQAEHRDAVCLWAQQGPHCFPVSHDGALLPALLEPAEDLAGILHLRQPRRLADVDRLVV
jgi:hypothetical protein